MSVAISALALLLFVAPTKANAQVPPAVVPGDSNVLYSPQWGGLNSTHRQVEGSESICATAGLVSLFNLEDLVESTTTAGRYDGVELEYTSWSARKTYAQVVSSYGPGYYAYWASSCSLVPGEVNAFLYLDAFASPTYYDTYDQAFAFASSSFSGFTGTYNTRFTNLENGAASGDPINVTLDVSYFIDHTEVDLTNPLFNPSLVRFCVAAPDDAIKCSSFNSGYSTTTDNYTTEISTIIPDAYYTGTNTFDFNIQFWNQAAVFDDSLAPFKRTSIQGQFVITDGSFTSLTFDPIQTGLQSQEDVTLPCSITQIDNCIINSVRYLFVPSDETIDEFFLINSSLETKFPFAYAYDFYDVSANLYNSSTTQNLGLTLPFGDLGSTTIISTAQLEAVPFASSLRAIIAGLIWAMFAFLMYRRTLVVFNKV